MYLARNAYPETQYSVHQCACFTHVKYHSHTIAVKRISHYLQGALGTISPTQVKHNQTVEREVAELPSPHSSRDKGNTNNENTNVELPICF